MYIVLYRVAGHISIEFTWTIGRLMTVRYSVLFHYGKAGNKQEWAIGGVFPDIEELFNKYPRCDCNSKDIQMVPYLLTVNW